MPKMFESNNKIIQEYGHRTIIGIKFQSWGSFTTYLFHDDKIRNEFDEVIFHFNGAPFSCKNEKDDLSLTSAYFGRPIDVTTFNMPINSTKLEDALQKIDHVLPQLYEGEKNKYSKPILVISDIDADKNHIIKIHAYYIWQLK